MSDTGSNMVQLTKECVERILNYLELEHDRQEDEKAEFFERAEFDNLAARTQRTIDDLLDLIAEIKGGGKNQLANLIADAERASASAPSNNRDIIMMTYIREVAKGTDRGDADVLIERLAQRSHWRDNAQDTGKDGYLESYPEDPDSLFPHRGIYMPLLRLAGEDLDRLYGVEMDAGGNRVSLRFRNENESLLNDTDLMSFADATFRRYGLGTVGHESCHWSYVGKVHGWVSLSGNPYPGCAHDLAWEFIV